MGLRFLRSRWRLLAIAGLATALVAGTAGCGGGADANTLTYWSMWKVGEPQQKVLAHAIDDFQRSTGIHVDVQWQGRNNVQKLVPALNTNAVPDLIDGSYVNLYPALAATKQAHGLGSAYRAKVDGQRVESLIPAKYRKGIDLKLDGGQPWLLPYTVTSDAVWFNAKRHPELVHNPPKTWARFVSVLDEMKAAGQTPLAADGDVAGYNAAYFVTLVDRNLGPGAFKKIAADKTVAGWDDPGVLDAARKVRQLVSGHYLIKGYGASKFPAQQQKWADNKAELMFMGSWLPTESAAYAAKDFSYASFPFPTTPAGHDSVRADFSGFAVPAKAEHASAAQRFAAFFLGKKYQDELGTKAKIIPIRSDADTAPQLTGVTTALARADSFHQQNDGVAYPGFNEKVFWPKDDELFHGKLTPQQFVHRMKAAQVSYWKTQRR